MVNLETVNTYEGTHDVHALILGRAITGERAKMPARVMWENFIFICFLTVNLNQFQRSDLFFVTAITAIVTISTIECGI
jgi:hypothetical protein